MTQHYQLDPLLPPQYKDVVTDDYADVPSSPLQKSSRAAGRRSFATSLALTTSTLIILILAAPLFLLWRNGVFEQGWKDVLRGPLPKPDHEAFPTKYVPSHIPHFLLLIASAASASPAPPKQAAKPDSSKPPHTSRYKPPNPSSSPTPRDPRNTRAPRKRNSTSFSRGDSSVRGTASKVTG